MKFDEDEFDYKIGKNVDNEADAPGTDGADNAADPAASAAFELRRLFKPDIDVNYDDPEDDIDAAIGDSIRLCVDILDGKAKDIKAMQG